VLVVVEIAISQVVGCSAIDAVREGLTAIVSQHTNYTDSVPRQDVLEVLAPVHAASEQSNHCTIRLSKRVKDGVSKGTSWVAKVFTDVIAILSHGKHQLPDLSSCTQVLPI
jgi:hypothetical protein